MYVDHSLHGDPNKENLMDELNLKKGMRFKRKITSKFLLVLQSREDTLLFMRNNLMPTISSHVSFF